MQGKIKELINKKEFTEAFRLMKECRYEHIHFIEADYKNEQKVRMYGIIDTTEWEEYERQIKERLIFIVDNDIYINPEVAPAVYTQNKGPVVFISYSGKDREVAEKIHAYLKAQHLVPKIDTVDKSLLDDVYPFIREQFKLSDYVILLISPDSLVSGWVGVEHELAIFSDQMSLAKYIIATNDQERFNSDNKYYSEVRDLLDRKISEIEELMKPYDKDAMNPYRAQYERFIKRKNSIGEVFSRLKARGTAIDISDHRFEENIKLICEHILKDATKNKKRLLNSHQPMFYSK